MRKRLGCEKYLIASQSVQIFFYVMSLLGIGYPLVQFLLTGRGAFGDLVDGLILTPIYYAPELAQNTTFSQPNSPLTILFYRLVRIIWPSLVTTNWLEVDWTSVFQFLALMLVFTFILLKKVSGSFLTTFLLMFSYPMWFLYGRANPDIYCLILFTAYILSLNSRRFFLSAIIIALMGAVKLPFFFVSISLILVRKFKYFIFSLILLPIFFYGPLIFFGYPFWDQVKSVAKVAEHYHRDYVLGEAGSMFNNSLYGLLKITKYAFFSPDTLTAQALLASNEYLVRVHNIIVIIILLLLFVFVFKLNSVLPQRHFSQVDLARLTIILVSFSILLPYISAEYRLALFLPLIGVLIRTKAFDTHSALLFAMLLIPKSFYTFQFGSEVFGVHFLSSALNPILIIVIVLVQMHILITESRDNKESSKRGK